MRSIEIWIQTRITSIRETVRKTCFSFFLFTLQTPIIKNPLSRESIWRSENERFLDSIFYIKQPRNYEASYEYSRPTWETKRAARRGDVVNERTSCVWMRMTQQPSKSRLVASWWARRETSSVDSNYRYPTPRPLLGPCLGLHNAIYMLQVLIALHGCDRSASFAAGHEFVDTSTREGRSLDIIAGCRSSNTHFDDKTHLCMHLSVRFARKFICIRLIFRLRFSIKRMCMIKKLTWVYIALIDDEWDDSMIVFVTRYIEYIWNYCKISPKSIYFNCLFTLWRNI